MMNTTPFNQQLVYLNKGTLNEELTEATVYGAQA